MYGQAVDPRKLGKMQQRRHNVFSSLLTCRFNLRSPGSKKVLRLLQTNLIFMKLKCKPPGRSRQALTHSSGFAESFSLLTTEHCIHWLSHEPLVNFTIYTTFGWTQGVQNGTVTFWWLSAHASAVPDPSMEPLPGAALSLLEVTKGVSCQKPFIET